ncbi:MAG: hypothetical protein R2713_09260 [Ilumatobacteraceae bacterium]|nr:hypothetical protein [Acidimicrobiales bacterium]MCB9395577.1 hypothetical protein [Acidimicrobiaceae bacterium]
MTGDSGAADDAHTTGAEPEHADLDAIARRTSHEVQPEDPYTEPPNSTVDDWFGQRADQEAESMGGDGGALDEGASG